VAELVVVAAEEDMGRKTAEEDMGLQAVVAVIGETNMDCKE